jgi:uncharacterized membrane protein
MTQELITIGIAMSPTLEAHAAVATAVGLYKFSITKAFILAVIGTVFITPLLLVFWNYIAQFFMRHMYIANRFLTWLFTYTQTKHAHHFEKYITDVTDMETKKTKRIDFWKAVGLYVFVAVPGPFTGVWGGTVAAFVFGVPFWHAFISIGLGAISVALIDALIIGGFFHFFF